MTEADELRQIMRLEAARVRTLALGLRSDSRHGRKAERLLEVAARLSEASGFGLRVIQGGGDKGSAA